MALTVVGAGAVGYALIRTDSGHRPVWVLVLGLVSVALWVVRGALAKAGLRRAAFACAVVLVVLGALVAAPTDGLTVVPAAIGVLVVLGDPRDPLWVGLLVGGVGIALVALGAVPAGTAIPNVLTQMGGMLLAVFAGLSRRQFRVSEEQAALLRERAVAMKEEASRIAIARDLHDVLAHSLGGLVIQLDAVDALLESGDADAARSRVVAARGLAADGLGEARRAVAALRDPVAAEPVTADAFPGAVDELVAAHRSLGGRAELRVTGDAAALTAQQAEALQRALQEGLSNARKHAPGRPVTVELVWQDDRVRLVVSNPLPATGTPASALAASGGGYGVEGMRERFAALPGGGTASAAVVAGRFVLTAEAMLR
nr:histidine kinase [Leifsonia soli]